MEDEIDLKQLFGALWRGKIWITISALLFVVVGTWYAYTIPVSIYTANTEIVLEPEQQNVMDIESVVSGISSDQSALNTELRVFRSRTLIERLVRDLDLVNDPLFNGRLREPPSFSISIAKAYIRELILGPPPPALPPSERDIIDAVINAAISAINVTNIRGTSIFNISATTQSPQRSAEITNRLAELYIDDQIRVKLEKTEQATTWLSERVTELQLVLEEAEEKLKAFSSNTDLVSPEGLFALNQQLKQFRERRDALKASITTQDALIPQLSAALDTADYDRFVELANDQVFSRLLQRSQASEEGQTRLLEAQAVAVLEKKMQDAERSRSQLIAVERSTSETTARIERQSDELAKVQQLQRESEANRLIYEAFLGRSKEANILQGIQQADSRILSRSVVPKVPTAPRRSRIVALFLVFGVFMGAGGVLLRELSQNTFRTAEDLEKITDTSVLGQIPVIPARKRSNVIKYLKEKPNSGAAEAIRNLRTSLLLANVDKNPQIIMSTSSVPGEGKTTQSIALALNFAQLDEKVLLIEGDIRRRVFKDYFKISSKDSFLTILAGKAQIEDVIHKDEELKFDILMGESSSVNAADLFSSDKFASLLKDLRGQYDRVIIDTPPVLAVPDARVIGQNVDAIIYTVKWDDTSHRQVIDGLKSLKSVNANVSGLVLGQINKRGMKKYGYGDSYGTYQGYYRD